MTTDTPAALERGAAFLAAHRAEPGWPEAFLTQAFREALGRAPEPANEADKIMVEALLWQADR